MSITPTIGRVILAVPCQSTGLLASGNLPLPGLICKINEDDTINVGAFDGNGNPLPLQNLPIIAQAELTEEQAAAGHYAYWMPYQLDAASATAAAKK